MLRALSRLPNTAVSKPYSLPAPVGGWNARDALANMDEKDAIILENMFPTPSSVMVRNGYSNHFSGLGSQVQSLITWNGPTSEKIFAACGGIIIDVTTQGTASGTGTAVTGLANNKFQSTNFTNPAGTVYACAVNGADKMIRFDGSSWATSTATATGGFSTSSFIYLNVFKNRLFGVEKNTLVARYFETGAVQGTARKVDLSGFATRGGALVFMATWTLDAGSGVDDYAVFGTSEGEVFVFQGTDPDSANTWAMKGRWQIGAPLGARPVAKFGGDLLIATVDGVVPLSKELISSRTQPKVALTDKIQGAMSTAATTYKTNFGWELLFYPEGEMVMLNVPVAVGSLQEQYAMNTITGAWGQFTGISANTWALSGDIPYFGGNGFVGKFWQDLNDAGGVISWDAQQAFSYFGSRGVLKHFKEARPIFLTNGNPLTAIGLNVDYDTMTPTGTLSFNPTTYATWDTATWDSGVWGGSLSASAQWQGIAGLGVCAAMHLTGQSSGINVEWAATDFVFERGGIGIG